MKTWFTTNVCRMSVWMVWCWANGWFVTRLYFDSSLPGQNGRHFADDIFRSIFMNEKFCILIKISLKFVSKGPIDNNPSLV